ncbi:MAG: spore coat protein [Clostridiaceae bacterium]|nr:spore coat protein [Clostridiaceae bacterium]
MNDKELTHDLLSSEKQVVSSYSTGITESSCMNLRNTLMNNFKTAQDLQFKVFDTMKTKGWYATKDAPSAEVSQLKADASQISTELV